MYRLESLEILWLNEQPRLASLEAGLFDPLRNLVHLHMDNCHELRTIAAYAFSGLTKLIRLYITDNIALNSISPNAFQGLAQCTDLDISRCSALQLEPGVFAGLSNLEILTAQSLQSMKTIEQNVFDHLPVLKILYLGYNSFREIVPGVFQNLRSLTELHLSYQSSLVNIYNGTFAGLDNLGYLSLASVPLLGLSSASFVGVFSGAPKLNHVTVRGCSITLIPSGFFAGMSLSLPAGKFVMDENPSNCVLNVSAPAGVTCTCALSYFNGNEMLRGGDEGHCICPAGQYASSGIGANSLFSIAMWSLDLMLQLCLN